MFLPSPTGPALKIGLIRTTSIGDVVLATACLQLLTQMRTPVEVTWIGREPSLSLLRESYPSLTLVELEKTYQVADIVKRLSDLHFLVDLQTTLRSRVIGRAFKKVYGRPVYVCQKGYFQRGRLVLEGRMYGRRRELPPKAIKPQRRQYQMMADALLEALSRQLPPEYCDGLAGVDARPLLPVARDDRRRPWQKELAFGNWLAVAPGASYECKRAPLEVFVGVLKAVRERYYGKGGAHSPPLGLVLLGDSQDRGIGLDLLRQVGWNDPVLNLAGKVSLWESCLALAEVHCLLSNDSGLGHMAEAVGTPCVALFGPTVEGFGFAPHLPESRAFSVALGCRPCSKHGKTPCRFGDQLCFQAIPRESVADHLMALFGSTTPRARKETHDSTGKSLEEGPFSYL